jgi:hypothetical protein
MSWRYTIAKGEAALRAYYASFPLRSLAVKREAERIIAELRANPPGPPRSAPINDGEDYELESRPGEAMRNGMLSPGT